MKKHRVVCLLTALCVLSASGCAYRKESGGAGSKPFQGYPIKTDETLTYWLELNTNVSSTTPDLGLTPFAEEIRKKTGVKVKYIHPAQAVQGTEQSSLQMLIASGDMPDIIEYNWDGLNNIATTLGENYIFPLNDVIPQYSPNLYRFLKEHPEIDKEIKTADGKYYVYPFLFDDSSLQVVYGPIIRGDWLRDLGMTVPKTIPQWYQTLQAFRDKKGAKAPLVFNNPDIWCGGFGINYDFYLRDGTVECGYIQPGFKEFLTEMAKWYREGLIDSNIANIDSRTIEVNMCSGKSGATHGLAGSAMGRWMDLMQQKNPDFQLIAAPYLTEREGQRPKFGRKESMAGSQGNAVITTSCKNIELAARYLDYGYSDEGLRLYNFGVEGVSYTMSDGVPKYTELITNNPGGIPMGDAMGKYLRGNQNGPFIQTKEYLEQYYRRPEQKEAVQVWGDTDSSLYQLPRLIFTQEENRERSAILKRANAYRDEMTLRFIMGVEPIENFELYVQTLKEFQLDKAVQITQAAYERYKKG